MPTYQYRCQDCSKELEAVQKFTDPALTVCPSCQGKLRKVYGAVGVVFKGSGFYATDNRPKKSAGGDSSSKPKDDAKSAKPEKKAESTPSKPAASS